MNKSRIRLLVVAFVLVFLGVMGYLITSKLNTKKIAEEKMKQIPAFKFYRPDGTPFSDKDLEPGKPVVIIHFGTGCDNCIHETLALKKQIDLMAGIQIVMVSNNSREDVAKFITDLQLESLTQIVLLSDTDNTFFKSFGMEVNPLIIIYDKNGNLVKHFKGETKIEAISKAANQ